MKTPEQIADQLRAEAELMGEPITVWHLAKLSPGGPWLDPPIMVTVASDDQAVVDAIELAAHQQGLVLGREPTTPPHMRPGPEYDADRAEFGLGLGEIDGSGE